MAEMSVETILEQIGQLSASDRVRLYKTLANEAIKPSSGAKSNQRNLQPLPIPVPDPEPSRRWMATHKVEYAGQWVALDGDRLIASGDTEAEVADAAEADGAYLPLIGYIPHPDEPTFIGV